MQELLEMMHEGGVWMYAVLLLGMIGISTPPLLAILRMAKLRLPAVLWWIPGFLAMFPGFLGSALSLRRGLEVIPLVEPSQRGVIAHAATGEGLVPAMAGLAFSSLVLCFSALLAGLLSLWGADEDERAETRLAGAVALALSLGAFVGARALASAREIHRALRFVAPEMRGMLVAAGESQQVGLMGLFVVAVGALVAFGMVMPVASRLGRTRIFVSLGVGGGALVLLGLLAGASYGTARELSRFMPEQRQAELMARLPGLPLPVQLNGTDGQVEVFSLPVLQRQGAQWVDLLGGQALGPDESPYTAAFVATTLAQELPNLGHRSAELHLLVKAGPGLGAVPIWLEAASETDDPGARFDSSLFVIERESGAALACMGCTELSVEVLDEAQGRLEKLFAAESAANELVIVPGARFTVQDVLSLCLSARAYSPQARCTVMSRAPALAPPTPKVDAISDGFSETAPIILGALSREAITEVIRRNSGQIKYCYERELTKDSSLSGRVIVKFTIANDGSVSAAAIKLNDPGMEAVGECLTGRFARFHFPEPTGGGIVIVSYPFTFTAER